jgi:hypothetical protein
MIRPARVSARWMAVLMAVVLTNFAAQVPYTLHLYGPTFNARGAALLGVTLVWFLAGSWGLARGWSAGYWLLVSFLAVEFVFYFRNDILLIPYGYGLPYHLVHVSDPLLWVVFLIGDVNFVAAGFFVWDLLRRGHSSQPAPWP